MNYIDCPLYGIQSQKKLKYILRIKDHNLLKQDYVISMFNSPYIDRTKKPRLIEPPRDQLKTVQKKIKALLEKIQVPDNVFSGIKGKSYCDNAHLHLGTNVRNLYKIDLKDFFPSISRDLVYRFFHEDLRCSADVAKILTNLTTIDLKRLNQNSISDVWNYLADKDIKCYNHLISGAPTSQILSYLVNRNMFDELQSLSDKNNIIMTVYVDDITFSSTYKISSKFRKTALSIIKKYYYRVSQKKVKGYSKAYPKSITGVIINRDGKIAIKNALRKKIITEYEYLRKNSDDAKSRQRLRGLIAAAQQVDKSAYPNIRKFAFENPVKK